MKAFDIEKAKAGASVCTRDGKPAKILAYDKKGLENPVVALVDYGDYEQVMTYSKAGRVNDYSMKNDPMDLMLAGVKKEGWIAVLDDNECGDRIYPTEKDARLAYCGCDVLALHIEWEEYT